MGKKVLFDNLGKDESGMEVGIDDRLVPLCIQRVLGAEL